MNRFIANVGGLFSRTEGSVVTIFALGMPILAMLALGAIELKMVYADHSKTQDVADSAALMTAQELSISPAGAVQRAQAYALDQLTDLQSRSSVQVVATQPDKSTVQVTIDTQRSSFFGSLLPPGGFHTHVVAVAKALNQLPLCVLIFGDKGGNNVHLQDSSVIQASACLVHSDKDIQVDKSAQLTAADAEASGKASGPISPAPNSGAPTIPDPFARIDITFPSGCGTAGAGPGPGGGPGPGQPTTLVIDGSTLSAPYVLPPQLYCQNIDIKNGAQVQLSTGEYYLGGNLTVEDTSGITGDDVVLQFAKNASFDFQGSSTVSLTGRKTGKFAGFVILTTRDNNANFTIESDHVSNLLGTIYVPAAQLQVYGTSSVAQSSAWTVITALSMLVQAAPPTPPAGGKGPPPPGNGGRSSPLLVINANYASSSVPVPAGVGNRTSGSQLVR